LKIKADWGKYTMDTRFINGFVLLDIDAAALNNLGKDQTTTFDNATAVKKVVKNGKTYTYISGQAWRYWWRETLGLEFDWNLSPVKRDSNVAYTEANPIRYMDDDIFGYMRAEKSGTLTRISPLKNSVLISVTPVIPTNEWSVMARHQGDPVPYEKQVYSSVMKGMFSLDLDQVGTFSLQNRTGYLNLSSSTQKEAEKAGCELVDDLIAKDEKGNYIKRLRLPKEERIKRVSDVISALKFISGGAKRTTNFADVTPKFIVLSIQKGGNHPFSHIAVDDSRVAKISFEALEEIVRDRKDQFLTKIYIGKQKGFMDDIEERLKGLPEEDFVVGSVAEIIDKFTEEIGKYIP